MTIEPNRMFSGLDRCGHTLTRLSFLHWKTTESRVTLTCANSHYFTPPREIRMALGQFQQVLPGRDSPSMATQRLPERRGPILESVIFPLPSNVELSIWRVLAALRQTALLRTPSLPNCCVTTAALGLFAAGPVLTLWPVPSARCSRLLELTTSVRTYIVSPCSLTVGTSMPVHQPPVRTLSASTQVRAAPAPPLASC
jgi:hypothetical protein